mmetsp:Transcript_11157/g.16631  ORF Transcript_11157/g.16631 Transcript_11157/m.16631 type:complete len:332 (-) Transcript_11157:76-1071(-)
MKFIVCSLLIVLSCLPSSLCSKVSKRIRDFKQLQIKQKRVAVNSNDAIINKIVRTYPREFDVFVLFTTLSEQFGCVSCPAAINDFELAAQSYNQGVASSEYAGKPHALFLIAELMNTQASFKGFKITSVPHIGFFPALDELIERDVWIEPEIAQQKSMMSAEGMVQFISQKSGIDFQIYRSHAREKVFFLLSLIFMLISIKLVAKDWAGLFGIVRSKKTWLIFSFVVYTFSVSGGIFDIVRSAQLFNINTKTKQINFFHPQYNNQFVVEGFFMGIANLLCGWTVALLTFKVPKIKNSALKSMAIGACSIAFYGLFKLVIVFYSLKNKWYAR